MTLDPAVKLYIQQGVAPDGLDLGDRTVERNRQLSWESHKNFPEGPSVAKEEVREIPGPHGPIRIRIFTPDVTGPFGVYVYFHGGGWVLGSIDMDHSVCAQMANASGAIVVAVEYRLAPEHQFPVPFDDCYAATRWVYKNAESLGADPKKIAVGGGSAGGNLAAAVALAARDQGEFQLALQIPVYPITDFNPNTGSYIQFANGYMLTRAGMKWFWQQYLENEQDAASPYCSPLRCDDLSGLAPALIITAQYDVLRDEGEVYAQKLRLAGVPVTLTRYEGVIHGFFKYTHLFTQAQQAVAQVAEALKKAFVY
jgi:acetyl esterase/lipase